jgi:ABC-type enterochelin transport system permease subunit
MALPYIKDKANYLSIMLVQGITLVVVGLVAMLIGPLFRPVALSSISDPNGRVIVENLYNSFLSSFNSQNLWLIIIGLLMCAGVIVVPFLSSHRTTAKK